VADDAILDPQPAVDPAPGIQADKPASAPTVDIEAALSRAFEPLAARLGAIEERLKPAPAPTADPNKEKPLNERLWLNPDETLREFNTNQMRQNIGPALAVLLTAAEKQALDKVAIDFDKVHGEGTFKEEIAPGYQKLRERLTAEQRADADSVRAVVNHMRTDPGLDEKLYEKRKQLESQPPPPTGPRGSRREPPKPEVSEEVHRYLGKVREATGSGFSDENWLDASNAGNSEDSWKKYFSSKKKAS
jgi:hypothetical protein